MGALTSVVTASEHQLSKDHKKGKAIKSTAARATSRGHTHGETAAVISSGLPGFVPIGSPVSQRLSTVNAGRKTALKRKAANNGLGESLPGREAKRPPRPRKKAAGQIPLGTSPASPQSGLSDQIIKALPSGPPVNTLGLGGLPVSSGLSGIATTSQTACISPAMSLPALPPHGMLPKDSEAAPGLTDTPELCAQVKAKSAALDATRCKNCRSLRCNGPEEGTNALASAKLKLQLFPFDDYIKKGLEQDGRNPHLELTLKARKSISSVAHHLVQKWGRSTVASGELRLFPFNTNWSNMSACQSWSFQDLNVSAADVHAALGSPAVFRLRYAWLPSRVLESSSAVLRQQEIPASNKSEPALPERANHPTPIDRSTQHIHVRRQSPIPQSVCVASSTVMSTDPCRPSEQIPSIPVSESSCRNDDARQSAVPANTNLGVDTQGALHRPSVRPAVEVEQPVVGKSRRSNKAPAMAAELQSEKGLVPPAPDVAIFAEKDSAYVDRSKCKGLENTSQVSGGAWLCESNDGFARQLWNCEDTFRSICGPSVSQMEWVNSLPDLSVSQLLGEASRAVSSAPLDNLQPSSGQPTCADSVDSAMGGQEPALPSSTNPLSAITWGEDTCDAFAFQGLDQHSKERVNSLCEELSGNLPGFDTFADVQELFDGEVSTGLGGLMDALTQGSLDEFQACTVSNDAAERDLDKEVSERTRETNAETGTELPSKDGIGRVALAELRELFGIDELSSGNSELFGPPEANLLSINLPSQDMEPLKVSRPFGKRLKKERFPPQRLFMLPGQYGPSQESAICIAGA